MDEFSKKGLKIALILHGLCILAILGGFAFSHFSRVKLGSHHVFQLEAGPRASVPKAVAQAPAIPKTPKPSPKANETKPLVKNKKEALKKALPEGKISYEDFIKSQGVPVAKTSKEPKAVAVQPITAPKIQASDIKSHIEEQFSSKIMDGIFGEYQAYVRSVIDASWEQPEDFSGYHNGALVEFDVDKMGNICNLRVVKSSGSPVFDDSVQKAFGRVTSLRPTPDGGTLVGCRLAFAKK